MSILTYFPQEHKEWKLPVSVSCVFPREVRGQQKANGRRSACRGVAEPQPRSSLTPEPRILPTKTNSLQHRSQQL